MTGMKRNQRPVWYAHRIGTKPVLDDDGRETTETYMAFDEPALLSCNVSGGVGEWTPASFGGTFTNYDRTISVTGACPLLVGDRVWVETTPPDAHDHLVTGVKRGLNSHLVALKEVPVNAQNH